MNLKKRLIAVAAVAALAAAAIYGSTMEMSGVEEDGGRLSWFEHRDTLYLWYEEESLTDYLNAAAVSFGEREGVRVIPVLASGSEYLEAVNRASLEEEQLPDVYLLSNDALEKAYLAGLASEVRDVEGICNAEHFPAAALSAVSYQGKTIAYPLFYETSALIYNETYLEEWARQQAEKEAAGEGEIPEGEEGAESGDAGEAFSAGEGEPEDGAESADGAGTEEEAVDAALAARTREYLADGLPATVDGLLSIADTFDVPEGVEGIMEWDVSDIFYNYWIVGQYMVVGGDAGDDAGNINIDNEEAVQCLEVYKSLNQFFSMESDTVTYDSVIEDFIDGKIVFAIGTTDVVKRLEDAKTDGSFACEYGVALMPDISEELRSRSLSVTNVAVVNGYSTQKDMANRLAAYLADGYADELYRYTGKVSANKNANADNGALQIFFEEYAESVPLPKMMETGNYWLQLEVLFSKVWNGADVTQEVQELAGQMALQTGDA